MTSVKVPLRLLLVKNALAVGSDEDIGPAIVIVITHSHAHAERTARDAGLFGDIGKGSIAIVLIESVANGLVWLVEIAGARIDQVEIHPAVVVVIEESGAVSHGFWKMAMIGHSGFMNPMDAAG